MTEFPATVASRSGNDYRLGTRIIDGHRISALAAADDYDVVLGADGAHSLVRGHVLGAAEPTTEGGSNRYIWLGTTRRFEQFQFIFEQCAAGLLWAHAYPHGDGGSTFIVECTSETWERLNRVADDPAQAVRLCEDVFRHHLDGHALVPATAQRAGAWQKFQQISCPRWFRDKFVIAGDAAHTAHFSIGSGTKLAFEDAEALAAALPDCDRRHLYAAFCNYQRQRAPASARLQLAGHRSAVWFEQLHRYMRLDDFTFAYALLTRSRQLSHENLRRRDPDFMTNVERALHELHGTGLDGADAALSAEVDDRAFAHRTANEPRSAIPRRQITRGDFRTLVSSDPNIGAGNFFFRYADSVARPDDLLIEVDECCRIGENRIGPRVTVSDFRLAAEAVACWYGDLGIGVKDLVALYFDNGLSYFIHYVALTRIGAIAALVSSRLDLPALADYLAQIRPAALVVSPKRYGLVKTNAALGNVHVYTDVGVQFSRPGRGAPPVHRHHETDPVLVAHTSGTTATPKPVQFNHAGFFHGVKAQLGHYFGDKVLSALPHAHGAAFTFFMSCVGRGIPLVLVGAAADSVLAATAARRPHMVFAFPNVFVEMCRRPLREYDLSSVRIWMGTGDASHERHIRQLLSHSASLPRADEAMPVYIDNLGTSELAFAALRNVYTPHSDRYDRCVGKPYRWADLAIFRDDGEPAADGEIGRLGVKSASVTVGYWNNSLMTENSRWRGYWLTGDLVYRTAEGFYYHVDRTADKIAHARRPVYSLQLEERLLKKFPEILDCSVVEHTGRGARGSLAISVEPAAREFDLALLESKIKRYLTDNDLPCAGKIVTNKSGWLEGITGKKLKGEIRRELAG